jgi:hypothetical protein
MGPCERDGAATNSAIIKGFPALIFKPGGNAFKTGSGATRGAKQVILRGIGRLGEGTWQHSQSEAANPLFSLTFVLPSERKQSDPCFPGECNCMGHP